MSRSQWEPMKWKWLFLQEPLKCWSFSHCIQVVLQYWWQNVGNPIQNPNVIKLCRNILFLSITNWSFRIKWQLNELVYCFQYLDLYIAGTSGCSSVLVTECGKSNPKSKCHKIMQKHLVFVNNQLKFQDQMTAKRVGMLFPISGSVHCRDHFGPFLQWSWESTMQIWNFYLKRIVCVVLQSLFRIFKNWLKHISALTACVCVCVGGGGGGGGGGGADPCSSLPTADENAVTVCCDYSVF